MPMIFEQQPRESSKAFGAFRVYLELGHERSLLAVAAKLNRTPSLIERWSRKYDWSARVAGHTQHVGELERKAIEAVAVAKAVEWGKLHEAVRIAEWQRHKKLIALADEMLARWEKNEAKCGTLEGIARVLELATKLGRLAAGMPTEVKEVTETRTTKLRVEWEVALKKVYGVAAPPANMGATKPQAVVEVEEVKKETAAGDEGKPMSSIGLVVPKHPRQPMKE